MHMYYIYIYVYILYICVCVYQKECQTVERHIKYQSICQLLAITRSLFACTQYFARLIIIVIIAIISQPELCTILCDDVCLLSQDRHIDTSTWPWLLGPAAC